MSSVAPPDSTFISHQGWSQGILTLRGGEAQIESGDVEENSPLGKAIRYLLNHYNKLTGFCRIERAQIDNNRMESMLKLVIRGRRNSLFFRTLGGAAVADVILSLVATCYLGNYGKLRKLR
ncbi:hypothetical protein D5085_09070 [Ectothiorhodospiraceae bacterium BW-2]|nr:hypothetical protein D5085_09070 [Ectothiorhodospiraceae bacterium BW-2]